jgi:acid phosphatase family membrane protein YuiD
MDKTLIFGLFLKLLEYWLSWLSADTLKIKIFFFVKMEKKKKKTLVDIGGPPTNNSSAHYASTFCR